MIEKLKLSKLLKSLKFGAQTGSLVGHVVQTQAIAMIDAFWKTLRGPNENLLLIDPEKRGVRRARRKLDISRGRSSHHRKAS